MVVTCDDCDTTQGITKGIIYRGEKVEVGLADSIRGRVSRANIVNPITDEVIVSENDLITAEIARKIATTAAVQLNAPFQPGLLPTDELQYRDARGQQRVLAIVEVENRDERNEETEILCQESQV